MTKARDLADGTFSGAFSADSPTLVVDDANNRVGVGTASPTTGAIHVAGDYASNQSDITLQNTNGGRTYRIGDGVGGHVGKLTFFDGTASAARMVIDSSGNVGIGTSSPNRLLSLYDTQPVFQITNVASGNTQGTIQYQVSGSTQFNIDNQGSGSGGVIAFMQAGTERARIDSSGNLLVGTTNADPVSANTDGVSIGSDKIYRATVSGGPPIAVNRKNTDGSIINLLKNNTLVGGIGVTNNNLFIDADGGNYGILRVNGSNRYVWYETAFYPEQDNLRDLGTGGQRWDDVYATNGTIQTSDANEKQDVAELDEAEKRVAVAAKGLIRKFRWIDAVEAKGDDARIHVGIIAQDLKAAFEAEGLDPGRYAMFISTTWWETQTEVPAVEAVEAQDAVYEDVVIPAIEEELDEEGNVIVEAQPERIEQRLVSEAVEAVEAKEAYTRTDTYDTLEEAPAGAVERTRLGVRYNQLLAFIIGAL